MLNDPELIVAGLVVALLLAVLAASEAALNQVGLHRVRRMLAEGSGAEDAAGQLGDAIQQSRVQTAVVIMRVLLLLSLGALATVWADAQGDTAPVLTGTLCAWGLLVMVLEVLSRQLASAHSERIARRTVPTLMTFARLLYPLVHVLQWLARPLVPKAGAREVNLEDIHDEILQLHKHGVLEQDETKMIQSLFEFGETIAKEVMVPRVDMVCVELGSPLDKVRDLMIQCGYTRLPVYRESVDEILGLINAKDLLRKAEDLESGVLTQSYLRETHFVPGTKKISKILRELQFAKISMAIVIDEYGGTDGLLTMEDIVEEIVGEITDEYDQASEGVQMLKDGSSIVDAKTVLEDVNEVLGLHLPVDEHETLGGYVYGLFGRVPRAQEAVEVDGLRLTVESIQRQRITRVRVQQLENEPSDPEDAPVASSVSAES